MASVHDAQSFSRRAPPAAPCAAAAVTPRSPAAASARSASPTSRRCSGSACHVPSEKRATAGRPSSAATSTSCLPRRMSVGLWRGPERAQHQMCEAPASVVQIQRQLLSYAVWSVHKQHVCVTNTLTWEPDALSFAALQVRHPEAHKLTAPDASGTVGRPAAVVSRTGGSARGPLIRRAAGGGRAAQPAQAAAHARLQRRAAAAAAGRRHARGHAAQLRQQLHGHRARQQLQQLACLAVCALVGAVDTRVEGVKTCA